MKHSEDWLESRIRWKARNHSLPKGRTWVAPDLPDDIRQALRDTTSALDAGRWVLLAYDSPARWSLIATRQFIGFADGVRRSVEHGEIAEIEPRGWPPDNRRVMSTEEAREWKRTWEWLQVSRGNEAVEEFWVPAGSEAFAVWNVLLMLARMESRYFQH